MRNPRAKAHRVMGVNQADYDAARTALLAWLDARADQADVDEGEARATHAIFANARVWAFVKGELGV